jgi:hypothetical protein
MTRKTRHLSQTVNQAIWRLIEELDDNEKYAGLNATPLVERISKTVIRELPDDLTERNSHGRQIDRPVRSTHR